MLRQDDYVKSQLVNIGWWCGKEYGGYMPSMMIMGCVANRVRAGWGSWLEVLERLPHFAAEKIEPNGFPSIWDSSFIRLLHEVDAIYDGSGIDMSKGALYWCDLRRIENPWFSENILKKPEIHPKIADCNSLALFR